MTADNSKQSVNTYTKRQIVDANRYVRYADFLSGNLKDNERYTLEQVDKFIEKHYGKGKGE